MNFNALASGLPDRNEQQWVPQKGWVYVGGVHAVIMGQGGRRGVFAESSQVSIDEIFAALEESAGIRRSIHQAPSSSTALGRVKVTKTQKKDE